MLKTVKVWTNPFGKDITGVTHGLNQSSLQEPEIKMELYQQRFCQCELKGREKADGVKESCQMSWILQGQTRELSGCECACPRGRDE